MKKISKGFLFIAMIVGCYSLSAQNFGISPVGSLNIVKEVKPPVLEVVPNTLRFIDATGNNAIDANEVCKISMQIVNKGMGDGYGCVLKASATGNTKGLDFSEQRLETIKAGEVRTLNLPIKSDMYTQNGTVEFSVYVSEPMGFGTDPQIVSVQTKAFESPMVKITDYTITGDRGNALEKKVPFDLQILVQNVEYGLAENVSVEIELPNNVLLLSANPSNNISSLLSGETKSIVYSLIANNLYSETTIPIKFKLREKYGMYSENKTIDLSLNQTFSSNKINVDAVEKPREEIAIASLRADVDKNIPVSEVSNENTFVIVMANENYSKEMNVPFARNDGNVFVEYCQTTLGIPKQNIHIVQDATLNQMRSEVNWLRQTLFAYKGDARAIVYYAGHGVPDEATRTAYLLPADGNGSDAATTGYKVDDLYNLIGTAPAQSICVFLDACFSGAVREGGMLASARGVALKAKMGVPQGNMVVFSAAQSDETAYPYSDKNHGMFTYFLLKKLQDTKGDVTLQELGDYITTNVSQKSIVLNAKSQTPLVSPAQPVLNQWQDWKLK